MKITKLEIENYAAFAGKHEVSLKDRGLVLITGENLDEPRMDSNGSAKSSLVESLDWCLYGKVTKGDHSDSIIHDGAKSCTVSVTIENDEGKQAVVTRTRGGKSKLSLVVDGKDYTTLDAKETQKRIDNALGMDRDVFHATCFFAQGDLWHFADATDKERIDILTKVLQLDLIDEKLDIAKESRKDKEQSLTDNEQELARLQGALSALAEDDFSREIAKWEQDRKQTMKDIQARVNQMVEQKKGYFAAAEALPAAKSFLASVSIPKQPEPLELDHVRDAANQWQAKVLSERKQLSDTEAKLSKMNTQQSGDCSLCGQVVTAQHLEAEKARLASELATLKEEVVKSENSHKGWADHLVFYQKMEKENQAKYQQEYQEYMDLITRAKSEVELGKNAQNHIADLERQVLEQQRRITSMLAQENPFKSRIKQHEAKRNSIKKDITKSNSIISDIKESIRYIDFWVGAFGPKGLKSYILDTRLQELTDAANEWIRLLTGGTFWIRFETQTKGKSTGKLSNKINVRVFRYNKDGSISERGYRSLSGGERQRISLGIDFGLSGLIAKRSSKTYDLLILDELFKHLDASGRDAVLSMLNVLKLNKSTILVIDHSSDFCDAFENRILVRKEHGKSRIIGDTDGDRGNQDQGHKSVSTKAKPKRKTKGRSVQASSNRGGDGSSEARAG